MILLAWLGFNNRAGQDSYVCKNVRISLYSSAPIEDISAVSGKGVSVFDASTGDLAFSVEIRSFHFEKSLMEEHFNSDYMESDKYPRAVFKGKINETIRLSQDGSFPVTVTGMLTVHGVTQKRTISGTMKISGGTVSLASQFMVRCADHHIDIPTIVFHHIAESIRVNVSAVYSPYPTR